MITKETGTYGYTRDLYDVWRRPYLPPSDMAKAMKQKARAEAHIESFVQQLMDKYHPRETSK